MDIKSAMLVATEAIINSCEYGEEAALDTYDDALAHTEDLSSEQLMMIKEQHSAIKANQKNKRFKQSYGLNFACWI
jgi:hypothetical protein